MSSPQTSRNHDTAANDAVEDEISEIHHDTVDEGMERLNRSWRALIVTGLLGGIEIGFGILAYMTVLHETDNHLLAGLAFSVGFVALYLAHSELFTEGFFYPIMAVWGGDGSWTQLLRLWVVTFIFNMVGGAIVMFFVVNAYPELAPTFIESAHHFLEVPVSLKGISLAILGGGAITLMTRMQAGSDSDVATIIAAVAGAFLLAGLSLFHSVLDSIIIFAAMMHGADDVTWMGWLSWVWYVALFNVLGGIFLVTLPRIMRASEIYDMP